MSPTRRAFLQSTIALGTGVVGAASAASPQGRSWPDPTRREGPSPIASVADSEIKVPKVKFGKFVISRLVIGSNPFMASGHGSENWAATMREWYTQARVVEVLKRCEKFGLTTTNYMLRNRSDADWQRYVAEGGRLNMIVQAAGSSIEEDPADMVKAFKPMAAYVVGERTDTAFREGKMGIIRDYCKKIRDLGVSMVGVGSHMPQVLAMVEDQGWDVDFYSGCVYNRRRTPEELRKLLGGELPEGLPEVYLQDDPERMYKFFRQTKKPCEAFKILAAGRVRNVEAAFKQAFQSIKPNDVVCVGMFPRYKDEVKEDLYWATRYGSLTS
jgi:hypothetical protein